jgi:FkbM family methyltransferase
MRAVYRIQPLAKAIRHSLNRAAPPGLTTTTIAAGGLAGEKMLLDLQAEKDYWLGSYEIDLQHAVADWIKPGWVVYDIGANIGYVTLLLAKAVGRQGKVIAFEALPANVERLKHNIALKSEGLAEISVIPAAVVDRSGQVQFLVGPSDDMGKVDGSAGRSDLPYGEKIRVDGLSLDEFLSQDNPAPQAVKLDIEGGELLALPGMRRLLAETQPLLFLELHGDIAAQTCWQELKAAGYRIYRMQRGYPEVDALSELNWKSYLVARAGQRRPVQDNSMERDLE